MTNYLNDHQVAQLAEAGLTTYEVSASWGAAAREIRESCEEWYGFTPKKSLVLLAVKLAKMGWGEISLQTKNAIEAGK